MEPNRGEVQAARILLAGVLGLLGLILVDAGYDASEVRHVVRWNTVVLGTWAGGLGPGSTCTLRGIQLADRGLAGPAISETRRRVAEGVHVHIVGVLRDEAEERPGAYLCDIRDSRGRDLAVGLVKAGLAVAHADMERGILNPSFRIILGEWKAWALGRGVWR